MRELGEGETATAYTEITEGTEFTEKDDGRIVLRIDGDVAARTVIFLVRVQPRASADEVVGEMDGALKVRLRAPAVEGRANEALVEFLAEVLKTSKAAVRLLSGERGRVKRVGVRGVTAEDVHRLLRREA